ncbi:hypothetical protein [Segatella bryantii]|uniref:hypothetical protein n=1 Tax=Segatella bryantii TaxID=77095 RepID=UPI00115F9F77|nr:hypothetical protein [Segatella bryantii]
MNQCDKKLASAKPPESLHEKALGRLFSVFTSSLLLRLDEHDTAIFRLRSTTRLEGSHPQNLVIPHLRPLLISLHEEAIPHLTL